ncbi:hypothetical protein PIB30_000853 [Stylosanthes scabra]|uniref:Uncharacterized protein n=1 Tax=Stylosanthes scabra TaxID=79078 RepID=A0ABU6R2W6_9FABA|nr:hypothetical protein [Stylosanthes scabra]
MILSRGDPVINVVGPLFGSEEDLGRSPALGRREMTEIQGNDLGGVVREVEGAQMPHELNPLYDWVNRDVLGSPCTMTEDYLTEFKNFGVIFGGSEEEGHYRVELPRPGERVCELNLEHPRVPHWLWVNEVMFIEFGVRIPFSPFPTATVAALLRHTVPIPS